MSKITVPTFEYNSGVSPVVYVVVLLVGMIGMCVAIGLGFAGKL